MSTRSRLHLEEVFPLTRLLGRCTDCDRLVWAHEPSEWADPKTGRLMWPLQRGAHLFCGACAKIRHDAREVAVADQ